MSAGRTRRAWGWHPLSDVWAARIVDAARVTPGELVLDIGAGDGALTRRLVHAGARVIAVELHPTRYARLRENFAHDPVTVVRVDAADLRLPRRPFRVVANPPYSLSSVLLRRLLAPGSRLLAADLVLQRAVVRRYASGAVRGAGRWLKDYQVEWGLSLPRCAFRRPPHVDSAVLVLRHR